MQPTTNPTERLTIITRPAGWPPPGEDIIASVKVRYELAWTTPRPRCEDDDHYAIDGRGD